MRNVVSPRIFKAAAQLGSNPTERQNRQTTTDCRLAAGLTVNGTEFWLIFCKSRIQQ
jgi:hypothetical protein